MPHEHTELAPSTKCALSVRVFPFLPAIEHCILLVSISLRVVSRLAVWRGVMVKLYLIFTSPGPDICLRLHCGPSRQASVAKT